MGSFLIGLHERLPTLEQIPFIHNHPLFIPCTIAAIFSFASFYLTYYGFEEVLLWWLSHPFTYNLLSWQTLPPELQIDWKKILGVEDRAKSAASSIIPTSTSGLLHQAQDLGYGTVHGMRADAGDAVTSVRQEVAQSVMALLPTDKIHETLQLKQLIRPRLIIALLNYAFISFLDQAQRTLLPLMYTSPPQQYGLGLSANDMANIMAKWGSYNAPAQLMIFPWILQRYGPKRVYRACLTLTVVFFALFPVLHMATIYFGGTNLVVRSLIFTHMAISSLVYMAYGAPSQFSPRIASVTKSDP